MNPYAQLMKFRLHDVRKKRKERRMEGKKNLDVTLKQKVDYLDSNRG